MPAPNLPTEQLHAIHGKAIESGFGGRREFLFIGVSRKFVASLTQSRLSEADQLLHDLNEMNVLNGTLAGGVIPFERWLLNAAALTSEQPELQRWYQDLAEQIAANFALAGPAAAARPVSGALRTFATDADDTVQERVIFRNDLLEIAFLNGAMRVEKSVARLLVPRFENGARVRFPGSNQLVTYFGTAWLLGTEHVITNYHVITARDKGEVDPADGDLSRQVAETVAHFDYNTRDSLPDEQLIAELACFNRVLDYAVLRLKAPTSRAPLTLQSKPILLPAGAILPVNIIQHPSGCSKQIGIRNNLAAKLTDMDLAYYTDTEGGSSGSPVCTDDWKVVALHKESTRRFGNLNFQGKSTAWINAGTRIDVIIADMRQNNEPIWESIHPKLA
jgi:endonuclease G, mitochondrial